MKGTKADILIVDDIEQERHPLVKDMEEALREPVVDELAPVTQEATFSSLDLIEVLRRGLIALPEYASIGHLSMLFCNMEEALNKYDNSVKQNAINVDHLVKEKAEDKELNRIGHEYGMTMNQTVGFMDMCEQVNKKMEGSGVVAVPFWFHDQYIKLQKQNKALIAETASLLATLDKIQKSDIESLGIEMPKRTSIITGIQTPYIAGETGPRLGDEHLDKEHEYFNPNDLRRK